MEELLSASSLSSDLVKVGEDEARNNVIISTGLSKWPHFLLLH